MNREIHKLSDLLSMRNALEMELLKVNAEIDALTGASAIALGEALLRPVHRPDPMPPRMQKYLDHLDEQGQQIRQRTHRQH